MTNSSPAVRRSLPLHGSYKLAISDFRPKAESTMRPNPVTFSMQKNEFPKLAPHAPATVRLTPEQLVSLQKPALKENLWPPHHPQNPKWNAADYSVSYLNKYKCPHERCPAIKVQCPNCCNWFDSITTITQPAESQSVRCNLGNTEGSRQLLSQLTAEQAREVFGTGQGKHAAQAKKDEDQGKEGEDQGCGAEQKSEPREMPDGFW
ncbi:hypothetical protein N0V88_001144 [Collariella sp. IMI 366227]|nr:hypothetical protein N0V88_001144 [Collariella sp. IMI 366227]